MKYHVPTTNPFFRVWSVSPKHTAATLKVFELQLEETLAAEGLCPCCRMRFLPDGGSLNSQTLTHRDDCALLAMREVLHPRSQEA